MQTRQRWIASIAMGLLLGAAACGDSGGSDKGAGDEDGTKDAGGGSNGGNNDPANNGGDDAGGSTGTSEDAGDDGPPPDLNYIPANEGKCDLGATPDLRGAAGTSLAQLTSYPTRVATEFEICDKVQGDRVCAPCTANPFLDWLNAVDAADMGGAQGKVGRMPLVEYFRRALQYPLRDLLVVDTADETNRRLMLVQGKAAASCLEHSTCRSFLLQHESNEKDCTTLTQSLEAASVTPGVDGAEAVVSKESSNAFSFYVPLVTELPTFPLANPPAIPDTNPQACPSASEVGSEADFKAFLLCHPNLRISLTVPKIRQTKTAEGNACMQLEGLVAVTDLPEAARTLVDTTIYEDLDAPGFIRTTLSARLFEATTVVDPSLTGEVVP